MFTVGQGESTLSIVAETPKCQPVTCYREVLMAFFKMTLLSGTLPLMRELTFIFSYLTIIPGARMVNSPFGLRPFWTIDSEAMRARAIIVLAKSN